MIKGWEAQGGMKYYNIIFMRAPTSPPPQGGVHTPRKCELYDIGFECYYIGKFIV